MRPPAIAAAIPRQHAVEVRRLGAFAGREIRVARRERQPVVGADGFRRNDLDRHVELLDHAADDLELLAVLLAEDRDVGLHEIEELQHDGAHAVEESGPGRALELLRERRRHHAVDLRRRIHLLFLRREQHVDAFVLEARAVGVDRPRIAVEVLVRPELQPVDEDAGDHDVAVLARDAAQRQVARRAGCPSSARRRRDRRPRGARRVPRRCSRFPSDSPSNVVAADGPVPAAMGRGRRGLDQKQCSSAGKLPSFTALTYADNAAPRYHAPQGNS